MNAVFSNICPSFLEYFILTTLIKPLSIIYSLGKRDKSCLILIENEKKGTLEKDLFELGEFEVSAVTTYDDQKIELTKTLIVGKPEVEITYFDKFFKANSLNEYSLDLWNKWNEQVENVYVDVEVKRDNQKIDEFRTKSVDIPALMTERVNDYFDAREQYPGKLTFEMVVNFWNTYQMEQKTFQAELLPEEEYEKLPLTGAAIGKPLSLPTVLLWVFVPLIMIGLIGYLIWYFKKNKGRKKKNEF